MVQRTGGDGKAIDEVRFERAVVTGFDVQRERYVVQFNSDSGVTNRPRILVM